MQQTEETRREREFLIKMNSVKRLSKEVAHYGKELDLLDEEIRGAQEREGGADKYEMNHLKARRDETLLARASAEGKKSEFLEALRTMAVADPLLNKLLPDGERAGESLL